MATNEQVYTTRILLNSEQAKNEIITLQKKVDELRKKRDEAWDAGDVEKWKKLGKEIEKDEKKIVQMEGSLKSIDRVIDNMSAAGPKQLRDTIKAINKMLNDGSVERGSKQWQSLTAVLRDANAELKKIKDESKAAGEDDSGGIWSWLKKFNLLGMAIGQGNGITQLFGKIIGKMSELTTESIELAQAAEGIEMAFARIDKPGLLDNLRQATHGTVNDMELMKQAVKFEDFNLPVEQMGTFLAYAQQKAKDTGESIDYLVNSIVTGLGRKSLPILDNLGLSATEIREEMKNTGDMTVAVAKIIERNMAAAGDYVETAADRAARATARQQNAMMELGRELLPIKESVSAVFSTVTIGAADTLKWLVQHRKFLYVITAAVAAYTVAVNASVIATKAQAAATWLAEKAQRALNLAQKANLWGLLAAGITAAVTAIIAFTNKTKEANRCVDALNHAQEEANKQYVEQESRIRTLDKVLHDNNTSLEERRSALIRLKEIIPGYNAMLSKEGELINDNRIAIEEYLKSLKKEILMKVYKDEMADLYKQQRELEKQRQSLISGYQTQNAGNGQTVQTPRFKNVQDFQKYTQLGEEILDIENTINDMMETISKASVTTTQAVVRNREYWENELQERTKYYNNLKKNSQEAADALRSVKEAEAELAKYNNYKPGGGTTDKKDNDEDDESKKQLRKKEDAAKAESEAAIAAKTHEYAMGRILYSQYIQDIARLQKEGLEKRRDVYEKGSVEYEKLNRQIEELTFKGDQQVNRMKLEELQRCMIQQQVEIELQAAREEITEDEKQERLRLLNETFLADKVELYREGTKERIDAEWELEQAEERNRLERERRYQQMVDQMRLQYLEMTNERQMQSTLDGLDEIHNKGLISEQEYQEALLAIRARYSGYQSTSEIDQKKGSDMLQVAGSAAKQDLDGNSNANLPILGTIVLYQTTMEKLKEMYGNDEKNHAAYLAAKQQATAQFCESLASQMQAAYNAVNQVMSAASSYFSAQQEYETSLVQKKYESQIAAAGNNQKKVKKLQEKQQKEEAAIKTKYAKRAAAIQMAQAVAQTAISAINAYSSAAAIPVVGTVLAPIAAAMAIAAGMLQIATIKKQQQAQAAGYYEGGFTGGRRYKKEAGVVHEGEFVANHKAVQNPAIMPFLNFLDQAQRNNTVGSLTMQDVSRSMGASGSTQVVTPIVNVQTDNEELREAVTANREATEMLVQKLDEGIESYTVMDGPNGLYHALKRYERLISKK